MSDDPMTTILGHFPSDLGRIELRCSHGAYQTARTYYDSGTGELRETVVDHSREQALEWWRMCELHGGVFGAFPGEAAWMYPRGVSP